ncbi:hypothetical protein [Lysobacter gummosus]|uniref:hypothetical protein n=1 Tax=Lysobacter gummosus TaxID=262324 RepID=UPI00362A38B5
MALVDHWRGHPSAAHIGRLCSPTGEAADHSGLPPSPSSLAPSSARVSRSG